VRVFDNKVNFKCKKLQKKKVTILDAKKILKTIDLKLYYYSEQTLKIKIKSVPLI